MFFLSLGSFDKCGKGRAVCGEIRNSDSRCGKRLSVLQEIDSGDDGAGVIMRGYFLVGCGGGIIIVPLSSFVS